MKWNIEPIGYFSCPERFRFETPRQGAFADNSGVILLEDDPALIDACSDLAGVERIWVVFLFHLNETWKSRVEPPVSPNHRKISLFATRSPHRPNRIGISCVQLEKVEGRKLYIRNYDLLDGTPILDIKPYIPAVDAFPDSRVAWLEEAAVDSYRLVFTPEARARIDFIRAHGGTDIANFCQVQLSLDPFNARRKRLTEQGDGKWSIGCRTWQIDFSADLEAKVLTVAGIRSNYSAADLGAATDRYGDKELHRAYLAAFPPTAEG